MLWLTDEECGTKTEDSHYFDKGTPAIAPFPRKSYFLTVMDAMLKNKRLFILKSREMMTSWLACGYITWMVEWHPHMFWVLQCEKDDKAVQLIEYCRILHRNQPRWMQDRNPLLVDNTAELKLANGGHILELRLAALLERSALRSEHQLGVQLFCREPRVRSRGN